MTSRSGAAPAALLAVLLLAAGPAAAEIDAPGQRYREAGRLYQEGDFSGAAALYEAILAGGSTAPELEYNLGNAYLKAGEVGRAVLHYRRALALRPGYENAEENLVYARSLTRDMKPDEGARRGFLIGIGRLRVGPTAAAVATLAAVTLFFAVAALRLRVWRGRAWALVLQGASGLLAVLFAAALLFEWSQVSGRAGGVLVAGEVEVRAGPGENHTIGFRLHEGTEVEILRVAGEWREIRVSEDLQGWVPRNAVEPV